MVLGETLTDKAGVTHRMAGLLPHETRIDRPKRILGYRRLTQPSPLPWPTSLTGHEFHYSSARKIRDGTPLFAATDALGEALPPMGLGLGRVMGSYAHVIDVAAVRPSRFRIMYVSMIQPLPRLRLASAPASISSITSATFPATGFRPPSPDKRPR